MAVDMSFDYNFSFGPATPPDYSYELAFQEASYQPAYRRADARSSQMSMYSKESSPDTTNIQLATPIKSPIRQHGPLLLPKIRSQDQAIESPAKRVKKNGTAGTWRPSHSRSYTNPETITYMPAALATPAHSRSSSTLCSPISMTSSVDAQFRRASSCSLDGQTIGKYGFPTYRQMPTYISSTAGTETFVPAPYYTAPPREPSPMRNSISFDDFREELELSARHHPPMSPPRRCRPSSPHQTQPHRSSFYAAKLDAALAVARARATSSCAPPPPPPPKTPASSTTTPTTPLRSSSAAASAASSGRVKSFDRWNSAMPGEETHERVADLRGLAHLHRCMREHGCRYGFIMTEIELVVVRNGGEATPHFGYLEVASIPLAETASASAREEGAEVKMTALLALFYLHMLARDAPLQGQV
ncbi:hypothetical protein VE04_09130 [Pseudogymnoascus sp. 24MN13]|nr:hypothetical protein VE04_09130 [Pseudogymnoascus sp. 24MN13]